MRKGKLYISILLGLCLCLFTAFFTACKEETPPAPTLKSISVSGETEVFIDEFDYADYTITATYSDDSTKTATLTADNLSAEDNAKLSTVGTHALTVSYESVTCSWTVTLKNHDFAGLTFDDVTTTYDGTAKTLAVAGLPTGAQVSYDKATSYTNAGEYTVKATVTLANYNPVELTATLTINKATYDMSGVVFADKTVTYNGESHSITATNLPDGVTAQYTGNNQINADEYTITATFTGDGVNYNAIPDMTAKLVINASDLTGISFADGEFTYDGQPKSIYITGTLPEGVEVEYTNNEKINADSYTVTAKFTCTNGNYTNLPELTATLLIKKATYDMSGVVFKDKSVNYTGEVYSLEATNLPNGVTVDYENNNQTQAGEYTVTAKFTGDSDNYNAIPDITAKLTISASDLTGISFNDGEFTYDGTAKSIYITGELPDGVTVSYTNNGKINADSYTVTATFTCTNGNYTNLPELTATLTIKKAVYDMSAVVFADKTVTYDGQAHSIEATNLPNGVTAQYTGNNQINAGEYEITATFTGDSQNYELIASQTATLIIEKRELTLAFGGETTLKYNGNAQKTVSVQATNLVNGDSVELTVSYNGEMIEAGEYIATATLSAHQNYKLTANNTVKVTITRATHTVTFKQDGAADITREVLDLADLTDIPEPKAVNGYTVAWNRTSFESVTEDITVTANKTLITYTIEYVLTYGTNPSDNPKTYTIETASITLKNPANLFGMQFGGWYTSETFLPSTSVTKIGGGSFGNLTLYGQFVGYRVEETTGFEIDYTQGTPKLSKTVPYATTEMDLRDCITVSTGCTWQVSGDELGTIIYSRKIIPLNAGNNVFYLSVFHPDGNYDTLYELHVYRLDMKSYAFVNGVTGETIASGEIEENSTINPPEPQDNEGYTYVGWRLNGNAVTFPYTVTEDVTITAVYSPNENTLKFNGNGATSGSMSDMTICTDATDTLLANKFARTCYVFLGWATAENGEVVYTDQTSYTMGTKSEYTLYAVWGAMFTVENGTILSLTEYGKAFTELTIPETIDGVSITAIGESAFAEHESLISITIPDSVTSIGKAALYGCNNLTSITLPFVGESQTATSYASAFGYIFGYETSTEPSLNGESYQYNNVDNTQFYYYNVPESLKTVTVTNCSALPAKAFLRQKHIETVIFSDTLQTIGSSTFESCIKLSSIEIGDNVTSIGYAAFYKCSALQDIELSENLLSIEGYALSNTALTSITIPENATNIGSLAFYNCSSLTDVYITSIEAWCGISFGGYEANPLCYAENLYLNNQLVTELIIPENVTSIGSYAFYNCTALKKIFIPDTVLEIGSSAFHSCTNATIYVALISQPSGWDSSWNPSSRPVVWNCINVGNVDGFSWVQHTDYTISITGYTGTETEWLLPSTINGYFVRNIGDSAFQNCSSLTSVTIPDSVTNIGSYAFYGCSSLLNVEIGSNVTNIGAYAFANCSNILEISIPITTETIGGYAFSNCSNLTIYTEYGNPPSGWDTNWNRSNCEVVWNCNAITTNATFDYVINGDDIILTNYKGTDTEVIIPDILDGYRVVRVDGVFRDNTNITNVIILDNISDIGSYAFYGCSSLTSVVIPDSVTSIGAYAFYGCSRLTSVYYKGTIEGWCNISFGYGSNPLCNGASLYLNNELVTELVIPNTITEIKAYAFENCDGLTSVVIPDSVTSIGYSAFGECSSLTEITLPFVGATKDGTSNTLFGYIFGESDYNHVPTSLKKVTITGGNIGYEAFYNCSSLTSVVIGESVTGIGNYAFYICSSLASVTIGSGVTSIGSSAFERCSSLTSVVIGESVKSIGNNAFYICSSLASVTIGSGVTSIGGSAFSGCSSLTSVVIPDSVTSIGYSVFSGGSSLTIYCEATRKPSGWNSLWNYSNSPVVWGVVMQTYRFDSNGGSVVESKETIVLTTLPTPTKDGWYFGGWYDNADLTGSPISSSYYSATKTTLYAKWLTEEEYYAGTSFEKAIQAEVGGSYTVTIDTAGEKVYYKFTATESKSYTIKSSGGLDTYGYLYNSSQSQLTSNDGSTDFTITRSLTAGETYYVVVKMYSSSATGTFTLTIS